MEFIIATAEGNREMTAEEIAEYKATFADIEAEVAEREKAVAEKELQKQEVLAKLGLTADEVTALLA